MPNLEETQPLTMDEVARRLDRLEQMMLSMAMLRVKRDACSKAQADELEAVLFSETLQLGIDLYGEPPEQAAPAFPEGAIPA